MKLHTSTIVIALLLASALPRPAPAQGWVPPIELADPAPDGARIASDGVLGNFLPAKGPGRHPAILLLGGSEGGLGAGALHMARELQAAGFSVLQLSYYRSPGQPEAFARVPLETFDRGLAWLAARNDVDRKHLAVVGGSKGAEAALIVATRHPELRAVVAGMPSSVAWAAFSWDGSDLEGSSWSLAGKDVPWLPYGEFNQEQGMLSIYANGLASIAGHADALIPIERSHADVLLVCGHADALWPSCPMAESLRKRGRHVQLLAYEDAGHAVFGPPLEAGSPSMPMLASLGGSAEGNNQARRDSWPKVIAFLRAHLAPAKR